MKSTVRPWIALSAVLVVAWACASQRQTALSPSALKLASFSQSQEEKLKPEHPGEWAQYFASFRQTPPGLTASQLNQEAVDQIGASRSLFGGTLPSVRIENWGPGNFGGRLRGIVVKPDDTDTLLVGSVAGGVFKSTDGGLSWAPSNDFLSTLSVGSMIVDPDNSNRVFVGSGEGFFNVDAAQGLGILVSTDFGDTFTTLAGTDNVNFFFVNRLVRVPGTTKLLAATRTGIWGTDDWTAGSPVWTERSGFATDGRGFVDLKFDPTTSTPTGRIYASHFGGADATRRVFRSNNDGTSFTQLGAAEGIPTTNLRRIEIGVGTDGVVYLAIANSTDATRGLWRAPVGGTTFTQAASATAFIERQGWYDLTCAVKPGDSNTVYMGAVDMYKTTNSGTTITKKTFWNPGVGQFPNNFVHADHHVVTFDPVNPNTMYMGCDGGIFKSTDSGETWADLNSINLPVTQYYGIAAHPDGEHVIGGTQDNGSHYYFGDKNLWLEWFGGDGGFTAWDQQDPRFIYGSTPQGGMFGSGDGGSTSAQITLPSTTGALFIQPFTIDPNNGNRFIVGTNQVFFSGNVRNLAAATWTSDSGVLTGGGSVSATTISPLSSTVAYAGTTAGRLYRTTTLGTPSTWTQIQDAAWAGSDVTWVEVDRHVGSGNTLYVTLADYGANRVWKSTNGGTSWTSIHANLPDIPMFAVVVDPTDPDRLWLGSELGLWTTDGNSTSTYNWQQFDYGTAFTRVMQLVWATDDVMWIGTHGRSIYKLFKNAVSVELGAIDDSAGGCDADGYLDPAENATVPVTITNETPSTLTNLVVSATSLSVGFNVTSAPQNVASLAAGASTTVNHTVRLASIAACRSEVGLRITVAHDDGTGFSDHTIYAGADPVTSTLTEDAEDADTAFTTEAAVATDVWTRVGTQAHAGTSSWFASDIPGFCDKSLVTPEMLVGGGSTSLSFWLFYNTEGDVTQRWDGAVLELNVAGTDQWIDIGNLSSVAYDGSLFGNNTAPGRDAWSGNQQSWRNAVVNLGATYNGQRIRIRWRMICDEAANEVGFWVDDISLTNVTWPGCDAQGCSEMFADGFEGGNVNNWTQCVGICPP